MFIDVTHSHGSMETSPPNNFHILSSLKGIEFILLINQTTKILQQECIPVECVPSAAVAFSRGRVVCLGGVCPRGCLPRGCLPKGVSASGGACLGECLLREMSAQRGCTPPMDRMTDACENITF